MASPSEAPISKALTKAMIVTEAVRPLPSPWADTLTELVSSATRDLLVLSPYITRGPLDSLRRCLEAQDRLSTVTVRVVTDFSPASIAARVLDVGALLDTFQHLPRASLTHLPSLHAKVYVADSAYAIVTSANLTDSGLSSNYEFGLLVRNPALVAAVRKDAEAYAALGGEILRDDLIDLAVTSRTLVALQDEAQRRINSDLKRALKKYSRLVQFRLLRARARGKTTHGIFADTLLYLLRDSPKRTVDLHSLIRRTHPDLCDDTIDRVIDGVHFGKKWKHYVRTAQQHLKRRGMVFFERGMWYRSDRGKQEA